MFRNSSVNITCSLSFSEKQQSNSPKQNRCGCTILWRLCNTNVYIGAVSTGITSSFWQLIRASILHSLSLEMSLPLATSAWEFDAFYRVKGVWREDISRRALTKILKRVCRSLENWMFAFVYCVDVGIPKVSGCIVPVKRLKTFLFICIKLGHVCVL
jgi:hypothetical protein